MGTYYSTGSSVQVLCEDLNRWDGERSGRETQEGGGYVYLCIHIADLFNCIAETNTTL